MTLSRRPCGAAMLALAALSSCRMAVLNPAGPVGTQEVRLIAETFGAMLIIVIPVIFMALIFPYRYRDRAGSKARYAPDWAFSRPLELTIWGVPLLIIIYLGIMIWRSTLALDPYKPQPVPGPILTVDVVALDWKWLFIYPAQGIATINQLEIPAGTQVRFNITSDAAMNVFFVPRLGTQIYAMAGMETRLHLTADKPGIYRGLSANFSGPGFPDMRFETRAVSAADFAGWVAQARTSPVRLDDMAFQNLAGGSKNNPPMTMQLSDPGLFDRIMGAANGVAKLPAVATE